MSDFQRVCSLSELPAEGVIGVEVVKSVDDVTQLRVSAPAELRPQVVRALVNGNVDVLRIDKAASQLESIFMQLTKTRNA